VRTAGDPAAMTKTVAAAVHAIDPTVALDHVETLNQIYEDDLSGDRFGLLLYASFAAIALMLATVGIYGVMAFAVGQRTHEIGVRMALGAGRGQVVIMVLREALVLACAGLAIGLGGAFLAGRAMQSMLYGIGSTDFAALGAVSAILLISSLFASYIPARRASQVDPMHALRIE
jgi:putative ABC transport system permease protein